MRYWLILCLAVSSLACAENKSPNNYAKALIAAEAKNCGDVKYQKDATKVKTCIHEKLASLENFYSWFWFKAGDSNPATGLAMVDGLLYLTWFDRVGKGKDTYFQSHLCEKWDFNPAANKPVKCFMKKSKTKIYLFELSSFVELVVI